MNNAGSSSSLSSQRVGLSFNEQELERLQLARQRYLYHSFVTTGIPFDVLENPWAKEGAAGYVSNGASSQAPGRALMSSDQADEDPASSSQEQDSSMLTS